MTGIMPTHNDRTSYFSTIPREIHALVANFVYNTKSVIDMVKSGPDEAAYKVFLQYAPREAKAEFWMAVCQKEKVREFLPLATLSQEFILQSTQKTAVAKFIECSRTNQQLEDDFATLIQASPHVKSIEITSALVTPSAKMIKAINQSTQLEDVNLLGYRAIDFKQIDFENRPALRSIKCHVRDEQMAAVTSFMQKLQIK